MCRVAHNKGTLGYAGRHKEVIPGRVVLPPMGKEKVFHSSGYGNGGRDYGVLFKIRGN